MNTKTYFIKTYGCQANIADSERIAGFLESLNFKNAKSEEKTDMIIYNTCSVRESAEDRIFGLNKKLKSLKEKNSELKIILTGCMSHYKEKELKKRLPYIDAFLPNGDLAKFREFLLKNQKMEYSPYTPKYDSHFKAYVPISHGCDNFCSYCIVPYARGREVSRPAKDIINEVSKLAQNNYKEIWLLGQNVNSYKSEKISFADLLKKINAIPGKFWIRFTSPHPKNFSNELIKTMAECEKFPHYLNLPVQSGDNEILKKMKRNYTREEYIKLVNKIRKSIPDIALSTDTIVGFPTETKNKFQNTVKLYKTLRFDMAYISEYSERPGTLAVNLYKDNIPNNEKARRKKELTKILAETALVHNKNLIGKTLTILIDEQKGDRLFGRTEGNKVVEIISFTVAPPSFKIGEFLNVKIISATSWKLKGEII